MKQGIIIGFFVLIVVAFIVGSSKGSADDREEEAEQLGAEEFNAYKKYTDTTGLLAAAKTAMPVYDHAILEKGIQNHISDKAAGELAKDIYKAKGMFDDDETKTYGTLRQLESLVDLWALNYKFRQLATAMNEVKKKAGGPIFTPDPTNVIDYMHSYLSNAEMKKCNDVLNKLPVFIADGKKYPKRQAV